ncbi:MAG: hypothetical protein ACR2KW_00300 [Rubrobacter sp.]
MKFFKSIFGGGSEPTGEPLLAEDEINRIGTDDDLLKDYDTALERNYQAMDAEQSGNIETAISLYEESVAGEFVATHPYERLANIYEQQGKFDDALWVTEAFIALAVSGRMPKGSQRSAERKLSEFEDRASRLRDISR